MKIRVFLIILIALFSCGTILAQKKKGRIAISGTVIDSASNPVQNAVIMIDGKSTGRSTDSRGNYKIKVRPDATEIGIFSYTIGIIQDSIKGRTRVDFAFKNRAENAGISDVPDGEQYVNMGYNYVKKKDLTNSVGVFDYKTKRKSYSSIYEMIRELPGVIVRGNYVYLPGVSNLWGPIGPMYVVNGIPESDIGHIQPSTVESIVILRDSAAAIYGSRAFGGVILIKTGISFTDK